MLRWALGSSFLARKGHVLNSMISDDYRKARVLTVGSAQGHLQEERAKLIALGERSPHDLLCWLDLSLQPHCSSLCLAPSLLCPRNPPFPQPHVGHDFDNRDLRAGGGSPSAMNMC